MRKLRLGSLTAVGNEFIMAVGSRAMEQGFKLWPSDSRPLEHLPFFR
jgi:hypothetical protein